MTYDHNFKFIPWNNLHILKHPKNVNAIWPAIISSTLNMVKVQTIGGPSQCIIISTYKNTKTILTTLLYIAKPLYYIRSHNYGFRFVKAMYKLLFFQNTFLSFKITELLQFVSPRDAIFVSKLGHIGPYWDISDILRSV